MWTCRKCNAEVEANFEICWSCGTSVDGAQDPAFRRFEADEDVPTPEAAGADRAGGSAVPTDAKWLSIATYWVPGQVQEVQRLLEADGIAVVITYEFDIATDWFLDNATGSIHLQVSEADVDRARRVLADHPKETKPLPPAPPKPPEPTEEEKYQERPWLAPVPRGLSLFEELRLLESQLSALIDSKDVPDWKVNPAFHPDVIAFIQRHANNTGFVQKAQGLQRNRAKYVATIRAQLLAPKPPEEEKKAEETKPRGPSLGSRLGAFLKRWLVTGPLRLLKTLLKWALVLSILTVIGALGTALIVDGYGSKQLREAVSETEERDAEWTWEAWQATRTKLADAENAAVVVARLAPLFPETGDLIQALPRGDRLAQRLTDDQLRSIRALLDPRALSLQEARQLRSFTRGRWPESDPKAPEWSGPREVRQVAYVLMLDAMIQAHQNQPMEALAAGQAIAAVGRSLGDDPNPTRQLSHSGCCLAVCDCIERTLALCTNPPDDVTVAQMQRLLAEEEKQPVLLSWLRGLRLEYQAVWREMNAENMEYLSSLVPQTETIVLWGDQTAVAPVEYWLRSGQLKLLKARSLRRMNQAIEAAALPLTEQVARFKTLEFPAWILRDVAGFQRIQTRLGCAVAAVAAERYRLANGTWPSSWEQLVPRYLAAVPIDPFDGKPLKLRRHDDGLTVFSIGPDGNEIAFRMWDVPHRGRAAN